MKVYFFGTCIGSAAFSESLICSIKLLQRYGVEVIYKKDQTCCGQPSFNNGYYEETKKTALYHMQLFNEPYPVIVPSGSCAGMMKHDYLTLFEGTEYENMAKEFCQRVYELSDFLHKELKIKLEDKGNPVKVTWHSNCHSLRVSKSVASSKALLKSLSNVELIELEKENTCCGFGGTFSVKEPEISKAMVESKVKDILNQNVEYLITGDGGCLLNISGALEKCNAKVKTMYLFEFLAKRIGIA